MLKEDIDSEYNIIDRKLGKRFGDCSVSYWYSTESTLCLAVGREVWFKRSKELNAFMRAFGYKLYDIGANDNYIMASYNKTGDAQGAMMMTQK